MLLCILQRPQESGKPFVMTTLPPTPNEQMEAGRAASPESSNRELRPSCHPALFHFEASFHICITSCQPRPVTI